jgi:hypothetical protein
MRCDSSSVGGGRPGMSGAAARRWRRTLGGGVAVLGVVVALLEALRRSVAEVERSVDGVWTAGKQLAQHTQAAHLLNGTRTHARRLRAQVAGDATEDPP